MTRHQRFEINIDYQIVYQQRTSLKSKLEIKSSQIAYGRCLPLELGED